jgi:hypothetical protein
VLITRDRDAGICGRRPGPRVRHGRTSWYVSGPVGAHPRSTTALAPSSWLVANSATRQRESENSGQHESTLAAGGNAAEGCARQDSAGLKEPRKSRSRTNPWVGVDTVEQQKRLTPYMGCRKGSYYQPQTTAFSLVSGVSRSGATPIADSLHRSTFGTAAAGVGS